MFSALTPRGILDEERARVLREFNACHNPPGPGGGRFCGRQRGGSTLKTQGRKVLKQRARQVRARIDKVMGRATPTHRANLARRRAVAQDVLDYLRATSFWGTFAEKRKPRWKRA